MLNIFNKVHPVFFLLAFCVGLFISFVLTPKSKTEVVYPTPENTRKIIFKEPLTNVCYKYKIKNISCDSESIDMDL